MILLDTHVAVWLATNAAGLGPRARDSIGAAARDGAVAISAISFWEIALLVTRGRLSTADDPAVLRRLLLDGGIQELPLTGDIALLAVSLPNLHADPADRFIAATAIAHEATLLTADAALLRWRHRGFRRKDAAR